MLKGIIESFLSKIKANWKKILVFLCIFFLLVAVVCSCQGLANANGDNNQIVVNKSGGLM